MLCVYVCDVYVHKSVCVVCVCVCVCACQLIVQASAIGYYSNLSILSAILPGHCTKYYSEIVVQNEMWQLDSPTQVMKILFFETVLLSRIDVFL